MSGEQKINDQVYLAALAGLLHDVGKFTGRANAGTTVTFTLDEQKGIGYWHAQHSQAFVDLILNRHHRLRGPTKSSQADIGLYHSFQKRRFFQPFDKCDI